MEELYNLGISDDELGIIMDINHDIVNLNNMDIIKRFEILRLVGCSDRVIKNIVIANPLYLTRDLSDIKSLISKLLSFNISNLDITFESNPWLLNFDDYEIDNYIREEFNKGKNIEEIIDNIDAGDIC